MKKFGIIFGFLILLSTLVHAQTDLPLAEWTSVETMEEFFRCSGMDKAKLLHPWGIVEDVTANQERIKFFFDPAHLQPNTTNNYYCLNYDKATTPDSKHESVKAAKALSIRAFVHARDYESNEIDGRLAGGSEPKTDTVHVLGIEESKIKAYDKLYPPHITRNGKTTKTAEQHLNEGLNEIKNKQKGFYDQYGSRKWRDALLYFYKVYTTPETHKIVKGPVNNGNPPSEEWGSLEKGGNQFVCYQNGECAFFDFQRLISTDQYIYVLFYAGDGTSDLNGFKYTFFGELDDVMGLVKIPVSELSQVGSRLNYFQYDPSVQNPILDFAVEFEVVDTL